MTFLPSLRQVSRYYMYVKSGSVTLQMMRRHIKCVVVILQNVPLDDREPVGQGSYR
jgi:hypothetical protein